MMDSHQYRKKFLYLDFSRFFSPSGIGPRAHRRSSKTGHSDSHDRRVLLIEQGGRGGVADYSIMLGGALAEHEWCVTSVTAKDHLYPSRPGVVVYPLFYYLRESGRISRALRHTRLSTFVNGIAYVLALIPLVRLARRCAVVHLQGGEWAPLGVVTMLVLRAARRPLVWTPHNTFDRGVKYPRSHRFQRRLADRIILHSMYDVEQIPLIDQPKTAMIRHGEYGTLVRRGAEPDSSSARARLGLPVGQPVILLFGQLRPDKGVYDLLSAARAVDTLHVVLAGEDHGGLKAAQRLLGAPELEGRVHVREGFVPLEDIALLFAAVDGVALPYSRASASGVLLLAYGCSTPVVAYPVGALPEYLQDGETGWLCARSDPTALTMALRDFVAERPTERVRRGAAAKKLAAGPFSWKEIAIETAKLYQEL